MDREKVKVMLRNLFEVAEGDSSADGEVENALTAASNLMSAYQIERGDIFEDNNGVVDIHNVTYGQSFVYSMYTSICVWEGCLCKFIREFVPGVNYFIAPGELRQNAAGMVIGGKATLITFYGPDLDVKFAAEIFQEIRVFIEAAAKLRYGNALARGPAAAYAEGFARTLWNASEKQAEQLERQSTSDSTALVVVNRSLALREGGRRWLGEEEGASLTTKRGGRSQALKSSQAYRQGKTDSKDYQPTSTKKAGLLS